MLYNISNNSSFRNIAVILVNKHVLIRKLLGQNSFESNILILTFYIAYKFKTFISENVNNINFLLPSSVI